MADQVAPEPPRNDEAERTLGRGFAIGIPVATFIAASAVAIGSSAGPALLVIAAGALLGVIALLWASLRTLSGDAPLPEGLAAVDVATRGTSSESPGERKRRVLRALKDLELEHSIGKLDDADYEQIAGRYREQAKEIMREMDVAIEPMRAKAEAIARSHLAKRGLGPAGEGEEAKAGESEEAKAKARPKCGKCGIANDVDAAFCKKCGTALAQEET